MHRVDADGNTSNQFTDGDGFLVEATVIPATWLNAVQEELMTWLTQAGITPVKGSWGQTLAAAKVLFGRLAAPNAWTANNHFLQSPLAADGVTEALAFLRSLVAPASGKRWKALELAVGGGVYLRGYGSFVSGATGRGLLTLNAAWDNTAQTWTPDVANVAAVKWSASGSGLEVHSYMPLTTAAFTNAAFDLKAATVSGDTVSTTGNMAVTGNTSLGGAVNVTGTSTLSGPANLNGAVNSNAGANFSGATLSAAGASWPGFYKFDTANLPAASGVTYPLASWRASANGFNLCGLTMRMRTVGTVNSWTVVYPGLSYDVDGVAGAGGMLEWTPDGLLATNPSDASASNPRWALQLRNGYLKFADTVVAPARDTAVKNSIPPNGTIKASCLVVVSNGAYSVSDGLNIKSVAASPFDATTFRVSFPDAATFANANYQVVVFVENFAGRTSILNRTTGYFDLRFTNADNTSISNSTGSVTFNVIIAGRQ